ncbi:DJ-1/PfpI family protein [Streptomyces sp. NBC_00878]|uniref:DJ-1/PfpI family protein n=1 Tax=Streptomyces sp. NBC_00878 TaxID=2975854 RepID=UPI00225030FA|nr:DJ-1/PfpI family protein [Streptomyces sp. NBC_00878]MCX4904834.1 DJ-1/PfpI family protein [Streptomyces sp. NBC_00878]
MRRRSLLQSSAAAVGALSTTPLAAGAAHAVAHAAAPGRARGDSGEALRVHIVTFDGVEELDVFGPFEVFSLAARAHPVTVKLVTGGEAAEVTYSFGTKVAAEAWAPHDADLVVVPGGGFSRRDGPGVWAEIGKGELPSALRAAHEAGVTILGICTGVIVLSAAGLTTGRTCTTHHLARSYLSQQGARVVDQRVVDDGDLVTAGGVSSGIDGALWLVERELGSAAATHAESILEFERRGTVLRTPATSP